MNRLTLLIASVLGVLGAAFGPSLPSTAGLSRPLLFLVCVLGGLFGLWVVSYALSLDA